MPTEIQEDVLEATVCKVLSQTGVTIAHRMKRSDRVIIKFECRKQKQSVMYKQESRH